MEREIVPGVRLIRARGIKDDFRRHSHGSVLIGVVHSGERRFFWRDGSAVGEMRVTSGSGFFLPAGFVHQCRTVGEHGYRVVSVLPELWKQLTGRVEPAQPLLLPDDGPALLAARRLIACLRYAGGGVQGSTAGGVNTAAPLMVEHALLALHELLDGAAGEGGTARAAVLPERIAEVRAWLEAHCTETVRLATLADLAGCSPGLINRSFSQYVGLPPHEYLLQLRLRHAARRLRESDEPLAGIALETGFADQSHFQRFFRRAYGTTPQAYREASATTHSG